MVVRAGLSGHGAGHARRAVHRPGRRRADDRRLSQGRPGDRAPTSTGWASCGPEPRSSSARSAPTRPRSSGATARRGCAAVAGATGSDPGSRTAADHRMPDRKRHSTTIGGIVMTKVLIAPTTLAGVQASFVDVLKAGRLRAGLPRPTGPAQRGTAPRGPRRASTPRWPAPSRTPSASSRPTRASRSSPGSASATTRSISPRPRGTASP